MNKYIVLLESGLEIKIEAENDHAARYHAFDRALDAKIFSIRPEGCNGWSATAHAGNWCPIHGTP